ncbi:kinase-related protein [Syncephalis pseudoplumigaleata]|uniref:Kinase-related protein n=1 Tax=Syncephalis pseudoplumigaleata TaxID=1712513 RepID=A0A4P9Z6C3_9FUNG|nr:kinase-related protein [Syncephalis pseudoplumigaleata]|eukprot:RKP27391.1 kinase-related protein [Syncephalis pseudoplumigaleata]
MVRATVQQLANELVETLGRQPPDKRYVLGIAGVPGAGKTWLAYYLVKMVNDKANAAVAIALSMDGFHLTKAQLRAMPDPHEALRRRGAAWTFDAEGEMIVVLLTAAPLEGRITWPSFDHAHGDPVPDDIVLQPFQRLVIVEGLYLALDEPPWRDVPFDDLWLIELPSWQIAHDRLVLRHQSAGLAENGERARQRVEQNDWLNAQHVLSSCRPGTRRIELVPDESLK